VPVYVYTSYVMPAYVATLTVGLPVVVHDRPPDDEFRDR
jgi:hypothetical protein